MSASLADFMIAHPVELGYGVLLLLGAMLIVITHRWFMRRKRGNVEVSTLALAAFDRAGWGVVIWHSKDHRILFSQGVRRLFETRPIFSRIDDFLAMVMEEDKKYLSSMIEQQEEPMMKESMERSRIIRMAQGDTLEIIVEAVPWRGKTAKMLMMRPISKAHRKMLAVQKEYELLKKQSQFYGDTLNSLAYPVWVRAEDGTVRYCNIAYMQLIDDNQDIAVYGDGKIPELYKNAANLAQTAKLEKKIQTARQRFFVDGQRHYFDVVQEYRPEFGGTIGYALDVSSLEEAQARILDHLTTLDDILESSLSAMSIFGENMRLKYYNRAYVRIWGVEEAWLKTEPTLSEVMEYLREARKLPEQINFQAYKQHKLRLFTEVKDPHEEVSYLPDGRTLRNVLIPHSMGGVLFIDEDVTDRYALESSYNTLIAVQRETLDNLFEGVVVFGEDGRLRLKNPVFLLLWNLEEKDMPNGTHISNVLEKKRKFYVGDDWEEYKSSFLARVQSRHSFNRRIDRNDNSVLDCNVIPLPDGGVLFTYVDITATTLVERSLRERNEALQASDKLKLEFLANTSYELRSPLTSISGYAEMLQNNYFGDLNQKQRECVDGIHMAGQHLSRVINDILELASIEAGLFELELRTFDVYRLLTAMLGLVQQRLREYKLTAEIHCDPNIGTLCADEKRVRIIMFHLLSNAVKYSNPSGQFAFGALRQDGGVTFWVQDYGVGIEQEEHDEIFKNFSRGSAGRRISGAGLGLSLVKNFVEMHGGKVHLESQKGEGTRVTCWIPDAQKRENEEAKHVPLKAPQVFALDLKNM
ncbi:MAG: PAS domain-containing sensor histidine kinase [Alphaproteobacteria bacterium]|nr:MAG: PAS domain-containing sensor histidine kinase [Alphaproteobacteria bacterium]TAF75780.1 MAG: PAS domain-containing sensor histidine kinase [Alphaproteobacteria bacterium]